MQYAFHIIKLNPYECCDPVFAILYFILGVTYLILLALTRYQSLQFKPKNVDEEDVEILLIKKCLSYGLYWMAWAILGLSLSNLLNLGDLTVDYFILAFFFANFVAIRFLFNRTNLLALGTDWKHNPDHTNGHSPKENGGKSILKTTSRIASKFFQILPFLTFIVLLIGYNSQPPLEIMIYWAIAVSLLIATINTHKEMRSN